MKGGFDVMVTYKGKQLPIGAVSQNPFGWRFIPHTDAHRPSRKNHATPEQAIPRWVGEYTLRARPVPADREGAK